MATPISNSGPAMINHNKLVQGDEKANKGRGEAPIEKTGYEARPDTVSLSHAGEALAKSQSEPTQGVIQSAEQANQVAQGLKELFAGQPGQALAAQAKNISPDMMGLLKAG